MRRRLFLKISGTVLLSGCVPNAPLTPAHDATTRDADPLDASADATPEQPDPIDAGLEDGGFEDSGFEDGGACDRFVTMHDTYAQALYLDGSLGPLTGVIYVDYVLRNEPIELDFWHGHGNLLHKFTLLPEHFDRLKQGERVTL